MPVKTIEKWFQECFITPFADGNALNLGICWTGCRNIILKYVFTLVPVRSLHIQTMPVPHHFHQALRAAAE